MGITENFISPSVSLQFCIHFHFWFRWKYYCPVACSDSWRTLFLYSEEFHSSAVGNFVPKSSAWISYRILLLLVLVAYTQCALKNISTVLRTSFPFALNITTSTALWCPHSAVCLVFSDADLGLHLYPDTLWSQLCWAVDKLLLCHKAFK